MICTFEYDSGYPGPALPIAEVTVRSLATNAATTVSNAVVDSGADATLVPRRILQQIHARRVDSRRLRPVRGPIFRVDVYEVQIQIGALQVPKAYVVADPENEDVILGRDVLNYFIVTLNGLAGVVEISD